MKTNQRTWKLIKTEKGYYLQLKIKRDLIMILPISAEDGYSIEDRSWTYETEKLTLEEMKNEG